MSISQNALPRGDRGALGREVRSVVQSELDPDTSRTLVLAAAILSSLLVIATLIDQATLESLLETVSLLFSDLLPFSNIESLTGFLKSLNGKFIFVCAVVFSVLAAPGQGRRTSLFRILWAAGWWLYAARYGAWPDASIEELVDSAKLDLPQAATSAATDLLFAGAAFSAYLRARNPKQSDLVRAQPARRAWHLSRTTAIAFGIATVPVAVLSAFGFQSVQTAAWLTLCGMSALAISFQLACYRDIFVRAGNFDRARLTVLFLLLYAAIQALFPYALVTHGTSSPADVLLHKEAMAILLALVFVVRVFFATFLYVWLKSAIDQHNELPRDAIATSLSPSEIIGLKEVLQARVPTIFDTNLQSHPPSGASTPRASSGGRDLAIEVRSDPPDAAMPIGEPKMAGTMSSDQSRLWHFAIHVLLVSGILVFCAKSSWTPVTPILLIGVGIFSVVVGFRAAFGWDTDGEDDVCNDGEDDEG